ncbi:MAG: nucleoside phosphorylase [Solobacterium sp.]|jgi:nucleoside phosphorylase|nr:nucleoside phosphorylase [Solobacterium sp.]
MITDAYSKEPSGVLTAAMCYEQGSDHFDTLILTFSEPLIQQLVKDGSITPSNDVLGSINGDSIIYRCKDEAHTAIVKIGIGAPRAVCNCEELVQITGAKHFIAIGSCGSLNSEISAGKVIIPTRSWRDEGTSYHYVPASDWIEMKNAAKLQALFEQWHVSCVTGPAWTTDALYRETPDAVAKHQKDGCIACDMECSALQAWADFAGQDFYTFFYSADALEESNWDPRILMNSGELDPARALYSLAVQTAKEISKD